MVLEILKRGVQKKIDREEKMNCELPVDEL